MRDLIRRIRQAIQRRRADTPPAEGECTDPQCHVWH